MTKSGSILITFAWAMEIVGVTGGALNSTYTTFGDDEVSPNFGDGRDQAAAA
jgi:hypothetical protein